MPSPPIKQSVRVKVRQTYKSTSIWEKRRSNIQLNSRLLHRLLYKEPPYKSLKIGAYCAHGHEIQIDQVLRAIARKRNCAIYMPAFNPRSKNKHMRFHRIRKPIKRSVAKTGMANAIGRTVDMRRLDVLLVPMMAFDAACRRLGRGGGYYDRMLSCMRLQMRPHLLGVAWDFQKQNLQSCVEAHDVAMDEVWTPRTCYLRTRRRLGFG